MAESHSAERLLTEYHSAGPITELVKRMTLGEMSLRKMILDKMTFSRTKVDRMTFSRMTLGEMSLRMILDKH